MVTLSRLKELLLDKDKLSLQHKDLSAFTPHLSLKHQLLGSRTNIQKLLEQNGNGGRSTSMNSSPRQQAAGTSSVITLASNVLRA